jgi:hypothetical protein
MRGGSMLRIALSAIADAANISKEGKLNITGIFNNISATSFPAVHSSMVLVFVIEGERSEAQSEHTLKVDLIDEDGNHIIPSIEGNIKFSEIPPSGNIHVPQILHLVNVQFNNSGRHEFKIIINGEVRASVPINFTKSDTQR